MLSSFAIRQSLAINSSFATSNTATEIEPPPLPSDPTLAEQITMATYITGTTVDAIDIINSIEPSELLTNILADPHFIYYFACGWNWVDACATAKMSYELITNEDNYRQTATHIKGWLNMSSAIALAGVSPIGVEWAGVAFAYGTLVDVICAGDDYYIANKKTSFDGWLNETVKEIEFLQKRIEEEEKKYEKEKINLSINANYVYQGSELEDILQYQQKKLEEKYNNKIKKLENKKEELLSQLEIRCLHYCNEEDSQNRTKKIEEKIKNIITIEKIRYKKEQEKIEKLDKLVEELIDRGEQKKATEIKTKNNVIRQKHKEKKQSAIETFTRSLNPGEKQKIKEKNRKIQTQCEKTAQENKNYLSVKIWSFIGMTAAAVVTFAAMTALYATCPPAAICASVALTYLYRFSRKKSNSQQVSRRGMFHNKNRTSNINDRVAPSGLSPAPI